MGESWEKYREKIIGMGENSSRKSYYPELQEKIAESEAIRNNLQTIINSINDTIFIHDLTGRIIQVNKRGQLMFGIAEGNYGKYLISDFLINQEDCTRLSAVWKDVLSGKNVVFELLTQNVLTHEKIPVQVSVSPSIWDGEKVLVAVVRDFRERKKYEEDLIIARERAEESDRLKSAFLANMSHEIRTPMNGILGFAELMKDSALSGEQLHHYISIIEKSGLRLLNIINNLIDISKIESGQMTVTWNEVDVDEQIDYVYDFFLEEARRKGLRLFRQKPKLHKPVVIYTDKEKLYAILINLIKNSIKYTHEGSIEYGYTLVLDSHARQEKSSELKFYVKDTGIGIPSDRLERIFERFMRGDSEIASKYEGAGLGLSITKAYVDMLGGKIWVESELGKGSQVYFTLPYQSRAREEDEKPDENGEIQPDKNIKEIKILIAEDDDNSSFLLGEIVEDYCREILYAKNGKEAVELCRQHPDIDVVLMDIRLPEINGYKATSEIRKFNRDVIIIAQTAYAFADEKDKALEAGCTDYISKPVIKDDLMRIIKSCSKKVKA